jgi:AraC-like DNA-binding protein
MKDRTPNAPIPLIRTDHATADVGELPRLNANWSDSEYCQMDAGRFEGRLRQAIIGNTRVMEETQNRTVLKRGAIDAGRCNFAFACGLGGTGRYGEKLLTSSSFSFLPGGEFDIQLPPSSIVVVSLDCREFMAAAALAGHWIEGNERRSFTWDMPTLRPLTALVEDLLAQDPASPHGQNALDAGYLTAMLFECLLIAMDDPSRKENRGTMSHVNAYCAVRTAREFIDSIPNDPLTVLDLCRALGVSRRTLQRSFAEIHGIAPLAYLRYVRLNRARRDLLQACDAWTSVANVATHWGFWHLGRFSLDYRRLFGELPSDTLRRALS